MIYSGDVVLPDGRTVHGRAATTYERATNAVVVHFVDLAWLDGEPLTADEYNTELGEHGYLHEFITDKLLLVKPEDEYFPWPV